MLSGKNVLITGCSRGIGMAVTEQCAYQHASIWACCRKYSELFEKYIAELQKIYAVKITPLYFDLTDDEAVRNAAYLFIKEHIIIDVLINNAGIIQESALFSMTSIGKIRDVFEVNFFSQISFLQYITRIMIRQKRGSIINIASIAGLDGEFAQSGYSASKAALINATKSLSAELGQYGIRINAIAPGFIDTDMLKKMERKYMNEIEKRILLQRLGQPSEVADVAVFLASDMSSYITGQIIRVDGGIG